MACLPRNWLVVGVALITLSPFAKAQKPSTLTLISPSDWRVASSSKADLEAVRDYGGDPAVDHEYGVKSVEIRTIQSGTRMVKVMAETSPDPSSAYGLVTFYRNASMTPLVGVPLAFKGNDGALLARGRAFFRIPQTASSQLSENDLKAIALILANSHPPGEVQGTIPDPMPAKGLVPGSEKYLLGEEAARRVLPSFRTDLLGFSLGAQVQSADYAIGKSRATLLVIEYPNPQISRKQYAEMEKVLALNQDHGSDSSYGRRLGSFVIVVLNSGTLANAKSLLEVFTESGQITQHERYQSARSVVLQMGYLILANIIFVAIVSGLAIGGGIIFFLAHESFKRWLPQTQWGAQDEATIIRLKLN